MQKIKMVYCGFCYYYLKEKVIVGIVEFCEEGHPDSTTDVTFGSVLIDIKAICPVQTPIILKT